jgi:maltooligosyltrehalose trehalohydrolase
VHAIFDLGAKHVLRAIKEVADDVAARGGRAVHVVAESDLNDPRIVAPPERGGHGLDAQWSDDFHHAVHAFLTGERRGYYQDYGGAEQVAKVMRTPFSFAGEYSPHRGRKHGAPAEGLPGDRFVVCIQNHDQVGNRARGDRLTTLLASAAKQRLAASLLLLSPHLPLLFMGEEYGEENPFPFFCWFCDDQLIEVVREGRKWEFADFVSDAGQVPDPHGAETFGSAKLSWSWPEGSPRAGLRRLYRDLLAARRGWPAMRDFERRSARLLAENAGVFEFVRGDVLRAYFNLTDRPQGLAVVDGGRILFASEMAHYCGSRPELRQTEGLLPHECAVVGRREWHAFA